MQSVNMLMRGCDDPPRAARRDERRVGRLAGRVAAGADPSRLRRFERREAACSGVGETLVLFDRRTTFPSCQTTMSPDLARKVLPFLARRASLERGNKRQRGSLLFRMDGNC